MSAPKVPCDRMHPGTGWTCGRAVGHKGEHKAYASVQGKRIVIKVWETTRR